MILQKFPFYGLQDLQKKWKNPLFQERKNEPIKNMEEDPTIERTQGNPTPTHFKKGKIHHPLPSPPPLDGTGNYGLERGIVVAVSEETGEIFLSSFLFTQWCT